jgi:hypothetical protein
LESTQGNYREEKVMDMFETGFEVGRESMQEQLDRLRKDLDMEKSELRDAEMAICLLDTIKAELTAENEKLKAEVAALAERDAEVRRKALMELVDTSFPETIDSDMPID